MTSYSPPLLFDGAFTSHAAQTLTVRPATSVGFAAGADLFPASHAGVQVVVERQSSDVAGANTPYEVSLTYTSRPPPDNLPQSVTTERSSPWPETTGTLTQWSVAINAVARIGRSNRVHGTISGGLAFHHLSGTVQPVAFTAFRLGGHSVLFEDDFLLATTVDPKWVAGFDLGGDVDLPLARHAAIGVGYRLYAGPDGDLTARPSMILNPNDVGVELSLDDITARLPHASLRMPMTSSRFTVSLKIIG